MTKDTLRKEGCNMQVKTFVASLGIGVLAGAATVLMMPKHSQAYQMVDDAAQTLKMEAGKMLDAMRKN